MHRPYLGALLLATSAFAQQSSTPSEKTAAATASISGTVTCDDTRGPARNAMVRLIPVPTSQVTAGSHRSTYIVNNLQSHTDIYGHYRLTGISPGNYIVEPTYSGYLSGFDLSLKPGEWPTSTSVLSDATHRPGFASVNAGSNITTDLIMTRGAAISGRVLYADGTPAPNIVMTVEDATTMQDVYNPRNSGFNDSELTTDDMGRYRIPSLPPGTYYISTIVPRQDGSKNTRDFGATSDSELQLYSGGTFHRATATRYEVHPHDEVTGVDFTMPLGTLHTVEGSVIAKDGAPLNSGSVTVTDNADQDIQIQAFLSSDGSFTIGNVPPATYTLEFEGLAITQGHSKTTMGGGTSWKARVRAFAGSKQALIVGDEDPAPINITPVETPLDPTVVKRNAEQPPDMLH